MLYSIEEIERTKDTATIRLIPMKERIYEDENGITVIEYYDDKNINESIKT